MLAGGSGWTADACLALEQFVERWQLPVGCAFRFQDVFDNRHPSYAGDVGIGINPKLAARIRDADLILAIGPRLGEMTTGGYELLLPPRSRQALIHIHAGAEELGRVYAPDLAIVSSMACAAPALAALERRGPCAGPETTAAAHADYEANLVPTPVEPLDMAEVVRIVDACVARRHAVHQRRRQLQRLAASLSSLCRVAPRRSHAARADVRRDGLRPAGRGRRLAARAAAQGGSTSPATATSS